jgi:hypothetical protein
MKKSIFSVLAVAGMVLATTGLSAQERPAESTALDAASRALAVESVASIVEVNYPWPPSPVFVFAEMVQAADAFLAGLEPEQRSKAVFEFEDAERLNVWRDFDRDFGRDLLREHYRDSPHPLTGGVLPPRKPR